MTDQQILALFGPMRQMRDGSTNPILDQKLLKMVKFIQANKNYNVVMKHTVTMTLVPN